MQKLTANQNLRRRSIFEKKKEIAVKIILIALQQLEIGDNQYESGQNGIVDDIYGKKDKFE